MATKGNSFRGLDMRELEGGIGGGMSSGYRSPGALETLTKVGGPAALVGAGGAGGIEMIKGAREKRESDAREAASEMKREARGIEKTSSDRAREASAEASMQRKIDKAAEDASKGMKAGGKVSSASSRADGCATKGKTRGKVL
jgi:hypothetical protein